VKRRAFHALIDATLTAVAFAAAYLLLSGGTTDVAGVGSSEMRAMLPVAVAVELAVFYLSGLYRGTYRHAGIGEALRVVRSVSLAAVAATAGLVLAFGLGWGELGLYVINGLLLLVLVLSSRFSYSVLDYMHAHGRDAGQPTLLYGTGRVADLALREIVANPALDWRPIGFIDDQEGRRGRYRGGYPILGSLSDLPALLDGRGIRHIVVATRMLTRDREERLMELAERHGIRVTRVAIGWESLSSERDDDRLAPDVTLSDSPGVEVLPTWFVKVAPDFSGDTSAVDKSDLGIEQ
jgi:UDP-GlcNAc:undecaprenyl-phosphate GlcNAc-1-phosphate transferase